ncbi:MAG: hypothetical protein ACI9UK_000371 [Candidatus Krumholzibacteriia bacterium]
MFGWSQCGALVALYIPLTAFAEGLGVVTGHALGRAFIGKLNLPNIVPYQERRKKMKKHLTVSIAMMITFVLASATFAQAESTSKDSNDRGALCDFVQDGVRIKIKVEPGSEILSATGGSSDSFTGTFHSCDDGVLTFFAEGSGGGLTEVPIDQVQTMHFTEGRKGHTLMGAGIGLAVGLVAAFSSSADEEDNSLDGMASELADETTNIMYPISGLLTGALIGALIRTDRWTTVWDKKTFVSSMGTRNDEYRVAIGIDF